MSEKKREPLLSDKGIDRLCLSDDSPIVPRDVRYGNRQEAARLASRYIRDHYERLIDEGKLIVAKEVEMLNGHGFSIGTCSGCGILALKQHKHCPGCGGKIKRQPRP